MQWLRTVKPLEQDRQATTATAEGRKDQGWQYRPEHIGDRTQKTVGSTQRLVEHQAKRKAGLDGDRRIDLGLHPVSGRRRMPCRQCLLGEPHRQASPAVPARHRIRASSLYPVSGFGELVATACGTLRHEFAQPAAWDGSSSYGLAPVRHPSGIDPGVQRPPLRQGQGLHNLRSIRVGWTAPRHLVPELGCQQPRPEPPMSQIKRIGIDTSKAVFTLRRLHPAWRGPDAGQPVLRTNLRRR